MREKVRLGDVCEVLNGYAFRSEKYVDNGIRIIRITNVQKGFVEDKEPQFYPIEKKSEIEKYMLLNDDLLISLTGNVGRVALLEEQYLPAALNQRVGCLRIKDKNILKSFLFHCLNSDYFENKCIVSAKGVAQKNMSTEWLKEFKIPLLSVSEQERISITLDKTNKLISKRKQQISKLDELVKARFVEMFGDPVSNTKNLPKKTLPELGEFGRGVSKHRPRNAPELLGGKYPLIQTGEVADAELYITSYENTYSEVGFKQSKMWTAGTLCITIAANIAKTAILTFDACFPDSVVGFNANKQTNNIFIHYWFSFFQAILEAQAPESAQKNINLKALSELKILRYMYYTSETIPTISLRYIASRGGGISVVEDFSTVGELSQCELPYDVSKYFDNLCRLGLLYNAKGVSSLTDKTKYEPLKKHHYIIGLATLEKANAYGYEKYDFDESIVRLTSFGKSFCSICLEIKNQLSINVE